MNRMCLIADTPLIESGTAGYNGQVELIKAGLTQCYECQPKAAQKSYPGCTIRNTPSEPIHCIVWAKFLFNQLFGEDNADEDVSPDTADPEAAADAGKEALTAESNEQGNVERQSTRKWAQSCEYNAEKLFNKFFHDDIKYLLSMSNLWKNRKAPIPIKFGEFDEPATTSEAAAAAAAISNGAAASGLRDQQVWSLEECEKMFANSVEALKISFGKLEADDTLVWDKDDKDGMNFVSSCANIRAHIFGIIKKSSFEIKSMAGNIIPAIATTNAITAGIVVLNAFKVLRKQYEKCQSVYIRLRPNPRNRIFIPDRDLTPPNPACAVCSKCKPEVILTIDTKQTTVKALKEQVFSAKLQMDTPEATIEGKGLIVISSEEDEADMNDDKNLNELGIVDGCVLKVEDFDQNFEITVIIVHKDFAEDVTAKFEIEINEESLERAKNKNKESQEMPMASEDGIEKEVEKKVDEDDSDDMCIVEDEEAVTPVKPDLKRKVVEVDDPTPTKKAKVTIDDDDDFCIIEEDGENNEPTSSKRSKLAKPEGSDEDCMVVEDVVIID